MTEANNTLPDWMLFVGKWGDSIEGHPLMYHLLDSAAVAGLLWREGLTHGARDQFARWLKLPEADCGRLLAYWTSLHDLGKATPCFQKKHAPTQEKLVERGFVFPELTEVENRHHSLLSQWILEDFADELGIQSPATFNAFRFAIGGHHGAFHIMEDQEESQARCKTLGNIRNNDRWQQTRRDLFAELTRLLEPPALPTIKFPQTDSNAFFNLLTGFFVAADWISSQDDLFQYQTPLPSLEAYWELAQQRAEAALKLTGWTGWQPDDNIPAFSALFSFTPRPLQEMIVETAQNLRDPFLMIVEAPTGCGKTEAAFMVADRAIQAGKLRGCYIAMPTQATSNQMFDRTKEFLRRRYPDQKNINLHLVHGNAIINQDFKEMRLSAVEGLEEWQEDNNVRAMEWFLPRKRTLLAPFGVGTVDQAFLSVLRARHSFLRLFGLHRKVVIFDEVHAYDTYMREIFTRLLAWLRAIGSSVIILSATLPEAARLELLKAYQPNAQVQSTRAGYPRMSINNGQVITTTSLGEYPNRTIHLSHIPRDPRTWLGLLSEKLAGGGCAAVICNTVDRAQEVFKQIRAAGIVTDEDLFLLHARTPYCWRKLKEDLILSRFGKQSAPGVEPRRGIVVATQIIEQSLDLDFDLLITDLAPIDLLIQRIGRLHRHSDYPKAPPMRPAALSEPQCLICAPDMVSPDELPHFESDEWVYAPALLQRTYFSLAGSSALTLPEESDRLINQVYSEEPLANCSDVQNQWIEQAFQKMVSGQDSDIMKAENQLIGNVDLESALGGKIAYLKEEDGTLHHAARALTRNSVLPSVHLVCFVRKGEKTFLLDEHFPFDPAIAPHGAALEHALKSMVSVSKREVVQYFFDQPAHAAWKRAAALRSAHPVVFEDGECTLDNGIVLSLEQALGVTIGRGKEQS